MKTFLSFLLSLLLLAARSQAADGALNFSGTAGQYVQVPNFDGLGVTNEVTVEFWAQPADAAQRMAFVLDADTNANRFQAHLPWVSGEFIWDFGNIDPPSQAGRLVVAAPPGSVLSWRHYALVATQGGNAMRIYQNGSLIATKTGMDPLEATNTFLRIGGNDGFPYKGKLDDFRIWNVARTESQIRAGVASPPLGNEPSLRLYLRFDEASGTTAVNSATATGAAFNGTLNGSIGRVGAPDSTSFTVNTTADELNTPSGANLSLREAVRDLNALRDAGFALKTDINFDSSLNGQTITLTQGEIVLDRDVVVTAENLPSGIRISGNSNGDSVAGPNESRVFKITSASSSPPSVTLRRLHIMNGIAAANDEGGGGILCDGSARVTLEECSVTDCHAQIGGGMGVYNRALVSLHRCTLFDNSAARQGGGIFFQTMRSITTNLSHCTLADNVALTGGGIFGFSGLLAMTHCTVVGNTAVNTGGVFADIETTAELAYCIVAGNFGLNLTGARVESGPNIIGGDPMLRPLDDNGGPTPTMQPLPESPARDAAEGSGATTDQRGFAVVGTPDLGAFEYQPFVLNVSTASGDGPGSLRAALAVADFVTGPDIIVFSPNLSGQTITLESELVITNPAAVTVDAGSLPEGIKIDGNNVCRLLTTPIGGQVTLRSITLTNGNGAGAAENGDGGAILNRGTLKMSLCTVSGSSAEDGGAILNRGTLTMNQCTLAENNATNDGGAIHNHSGESATLTRSTLHGNHAGDDGGAIWNGGGLTLTHCTLADNEATQEGGAIRSFTDLTLTHCTLSGNSAGAGGGIFSHGVLNLADSLTALNEALVGPDVYLESGNHCPLLA